MYLPCVVTWVSFYQVSILCYGILHAVYSRMSEFLTRYILYVAGYVYAVCFTDSLLNWIGDRIFLYAVYTVVTTVTFTEFSLQLIAEHELIRRI